MVKVYISADTTSVSKGADKVATQARNLGVEVVRTGSRGLFYLEPMIEFDLGGERHGFGPLTVKDTADVLDAISNNTYAKNSLYLGAIDQLPAMQQQTRVSFARCGVVDPISVQSYRDQGGFIGLEKALALEPEGIVAQITQSGLRGRGGAAFPTGIKWETVRKAPADQKYIVCNADEGDSGTYADRMTMEGDPMSLLEGMAIAGLGVGATKGYIYLREEYPRAHDILNRAIAAMTLAGYLGKDIAGSGKAFTIEVRLGAWAYICGEETSLLNSLEGKRGEVRAKPPLPAIEGLFGKPTVVNNVLTLAAVSSIFAKGADYYASLGVDRSKGTMPFQLAGNLAKTALLEMPFGVTLRKMLFDVAGGSRTGRPLKAVQVGGPLGSYLSESQWDVPLTYEDMAAIGAVLGHGGIVAFDDSVDMQAQARFAMEFCVHESCGKCTPCRIGSTRGVEVIDKISNGIDVEDNLDLLEELCDTMQYGSLCAMGGMTPFPVMSAVRQFPDHFGPKPEPIRLVTE